MKNTDLRDKNYYTSLTRKIAVLIILVSLAPLVLISGTLRYYFTVSYQSKVNDHLKVLINKHRQDIDTFLNQRIAEIRVLARSFTLEQLSDQDFLKERLLVLQEEFGPSFVDLGVVDEKGIQVAYAGPLRLEHADYSSADWFKTAIASDTFVSDVFPGLRGMPHFIVAVAKKYAGKKWILRATVDFEAFNALVESIRVSDTGFAFILNRKGEFQTKAPQRAPVPRELYLAFLAQEKIILDDVALTERMNDAGTETLYVMAPLKNGEWLLAYEEDAADTYSVIYQARRLAIIIFLVSALIIVIVAIVLAKRMVKRISEADLQKEMMNDQIIEAGKLASLGELAAGIAHEINNPVAIMVEEAGWIQDLLSEEDLKHSENLEEFQNSLNRIRTQGLRCKDITHKLLSFARKTDPTLKEVQLNDLIREVVALSEKRAKLSNVKVKLGLHEDLPKVQVSPSEIQQVLLNLMNNAIDAMDKKGGRIDIATLAENASVVIDVADNGPGIAKANLQRIFDPFFTTKPVGKGTGLGLSICYGIVKKMGGEIIVESDVGRGTTFHVRIPMKSMRAAQDLKIKT